MRELNRHAGLLGAFLAQFLKARMSYRIDFFVSLLTSLVGTALGFAFIGIIFQRIDALADWSFYEVMFIYGFSLIPVGLFSLVSSNLWSFGSKYIIEGGLDRVLLRPLNTLYQIFCESFRIESLQDIAIGVVLTVTAASKLGLSFSLIDLVVMLLLIAAATAILLGFFASLVAVNFWIEDRVGIEPPFFNMLALGRYPLTIYNQFLKLLLSTAVPFAFIAFFPSAWFLRREQFYWWALATPLVAMVFMVVCRLVWWRGLRRYGSTGS